MAIPITFQNVEKMVFSSAELRGRLPEFGDLFRTWALSQQSPDLRPLGQRAAIDFCNSVRAEHLQVLRDFFGDDVEVKGIAADSLEHRSYTLEEAEEGLNAEPVVRDAFFVYREENQLYISIWR